MVSEQRSLIWSYLQYLTIDIEDNLGSMAVQLIRCFKMTLL